MSRSDQVYLNDILECIEIIQNYTDHKTEFDFHNDLMLQDAVTRRFEIIGEAASQQDLPLLKQQIEDLVK